MTSEDLDKLAALYLERSDSLDASSYRIPELIEMARPNESLEFEMLQAKARLAAIDKAMRAGTQFYNTTRFGYCVNDWHVPTIEQAADILIESQKEG